MPNTSEILIKQGRNLHNSHPGRKLKDRYGRVGIEINLFFQRRI